MFLGVGPGDANVYNLATWPEAIVFLGIIAVIIVFLYLIIYPFVQEAVEYRRKCRKCPDEEGGKEKSKFEGGMPVVRPDETQREQG